MYVFVIFRLIQYFQRHIFVLYTLHICMQTGGDLSMYLIDLATNTAKKCNPLNPAAALFLKPDYLIQRKIEEAEYDLRLRAAVRTGP